LAWSEDIAWLMSGQSSRHRRWTFVVDVGTFDWYKERISGRAKSLILLAVLPLTDNPFLGTTNFEKTRLFKKLSPIGVLR
jgi:hypothetical protein